MTQIQGLLYLYVGTAVALSLVCLAFVLLRNGRRELLAVLPTDSLRAPSRERVVLLVVLLLILYVVPIVAPSRDLILQANADIEGRN